MDTEEVKVRRFKLELCRCGRHGRVVEVGAGYVGLEFCSKFEARFAVKIALGLDDLVRKANEAELYEAIDGAQCLQEIDSWVDKEIRTLVDLWNKAKALGHRLDPVQFHGHYFKHY